ncbi:THAP domain-containing protein 6-like [Patella vulgata]|uniref:THAP domain-containing protein 6-like n=1 Tax=Patella vulgata TaxID=6465 RepID=UPI0021809B38|nr:THAP domain-containing protein 6-like [Patella vulgata]
MVRSCCAIGCTNRDTPENRKKDITFHQIPNDPGQRKSWLIAINRLDLDGKHSWEPSSIQTLCSQHFQEDDFMKSKHAGNKLLKKGSVPSIFSWKTSANVKVLVQQVLINF